MAAEQSAEVCWHRQCEAPPEALLRHPDGRLRVFHVPVRDEHGATVLYAEAYSCAAHEPRVILVLDTWRERIRELVRHMLDHDGNRR